MSFSYTIPEPYKKENLPNGQYLAKLKSIEEKMDKYGTYIEIEEEYLDPGEHLGRIDTERFYVGAYDQKKKERGVNSFNIFCKQVANLSPGEILTDSHMLDKKYIKTIENNMGKNGFMYQNTKERILVSSQPTNKVLAEQQAANNESVLYGKIAVLQQPAPVYQQLNDEVPF
ncbi:MAG: hypothetical protein ACTHJ2_09675 [Candidatus Nitrosocosmicus sp.]